MPTQTNPGQPDPAQVERHISRANSLFGQLVRTLNQAGLLEELTPHLDHVAQVIRRHHNRRLSGSAIDDLQPIRQGNSGAGERRDF
jgi:hypothetical protein